MKAYREGGEDREGFLDQIAALRGIYVPSRYDVTHRPDGTREADENMRAHGQDERIGIVQFDEAARFGYALARVVAGR